MKIFRWLLRVSIRRILLAVSLLFLVMPLGSILFLRLYESALIRQTESELIAQTAVLTAIAKQDIHQALARRGIQPNLYGLPIIQNNSLKAQPTKPFIASLDLSRVPIYGPRPLGRQASQKPDPVAVEVGHELLPIFRDTQRTTLAGLKFMDYQGIVASQNAATWKKEELGLSFAHGEEIKQALAGHPMSLLRQRRMPKTPALWGTLSRNTTLNVFVAMPVMEEDRVYGVIWVNRTPSDIWEPLYNKRVALFWSSLFLLALTFLISAITSFTITRPIRNLVLKTRQIAEGQPMGLTPLENPITSEMAELAESIALMAQAIQTRTHYILNFAAHVSHEFKTPLTAIQGSVELLQDHLDSMPKEKQRRFLTNIAEDTERLKRLVSRLLELAKADTSSIQRQRTLLLPQLKTCIDRYSKQADFELTLQTSPEIDVELTTSLPVESLDIVFSNLFENSRQAGARKVLITLDAQLHDWHVNVQDNGPGISEANQAEIFTPFFTTKRDTGGTGLGLSIVQSLLERQGGRLSLLSSNENGTCFRVVLPLG